MSQSLEGLHDVAGALGAMRSYVHLVKDDDPYVRKANAAIWEWEEMLKTSRVQETVPAQAKTTLENGNATVGYPIREKNLR
jgi:hypothetical protein